MSTYTSMTQRAESLEREARALHEQAQVLRWDATAKFPICGPPKPPELFTWGERAAHSLLQDYTPAILSQLRTGRA